ncbi:MAG TPA: VOC family protein [Actinomycetota bacterium]|nr:VOC family protein [Actinomycetota bacterium]
MITRARSVGIYVTDQDRALAFYRDALGFEVLQDTPMGEMGPPGHEDKRWIVVAPKGADTHFVLYTPPGMEDRVGGFSNVMWNTEDIGGTYEALKAAGVEFTQEPTEQGWGIWAQFKDPDGNEFGLSQARSERVG